MQSEVMDSVSCEWGARSASRRERKWTTTHPSKATYLHANPHVREQRVLAYAGDQSRSVGGNCHGPSSVQGRNDPCFLEPGRMKDVRQRVKTCTFEEAYAVLSLGRAGTSMREGGEHPGKQRLRTQNSPWRRALAQNCTPASISRARARASAPIAGLWLCLLCCSFGRRREFQSGTRPGAFAPVLRHTLSAFLIADAPLARGFRLALVTYSLQRELVSTWTPAALRTESLISFDPCEAHKDAHH